MIRRFVRRIRDNAVVLRACIAPLRSARSAGILRGKRWYSHVPYRGVVAVDCGADRRFFVRCNGHNTEMPRPRGDGGARS